MIGHNHLGKNGRFGNQMFQYAATKGIAANRGFDFCIPPGPATDEEFNDEENQHKLFMAFKLSSIKEVNMFPAPYRQEESFNFDEDLFNNCEDNVNLYGYLQSEKYFKHIEKKFVRILFGVMMFGILVKKYTSKLFLMGNQSLSCS
jgi:hypothetical protein